MAGITERSAQRIIVELEDDGYLTHEKIGRRNRYMLSTDGYLTHEKIGRRNRYMLSTDATLRHPLEQAVEIRFLLDVFRVDGDHGSTAER